MSVTRLLMLLLMVTTSSVTVADTYKESDLGALFTTPAVRIAIDKKRTLSRPGIDAQQRRGPSTVTVNGLVKRSDGKSTVWVNGKSNMQSKTIDGIKVSNRQKKSASVAVYVDGKLVRIKPGDTWSQKKPDNREEF